MCPLLPPDALRRNHSSPEDATRQAPLGGTRGTTRGCPDGGRHPVGTDDERVRVVVQVQGGDGVRLGPEPTPRTS